MIQKLEDYDSFIKQKQWRTEFQDIPTCSSYIGRVGSDNVTFAECVSVLTKYGRRNTQNAYYIRRFYVVA